MYPMECKGGFFVPIREGKFEVIGFQAVVSDTAAASQVTLIDDKEIAVGAKFGRILSDTYDVQTGFVDIKGLANTDGNLEQFFPSPLKLRRGVSAVKTSNVVPGTLKLYVR